MKEMGKIKVLQIIGDSSLSGAPRSLLSLIKGLPKEKFEIKVACPFGPLVSQLKKLKREVFVITMRSKWDLGALFRLRKLIKKEKPKIVHCHGMRGGWLGRLASIGPRKTAPKIIYTEHLWTSEYRLKNPISHFLQIASLWFLDLFTDRTICVSKAVADFLMKRGITRGEKVAVIYNGIEIPRLTKKKMEKMKTIGFVGSLVERKGLDDLFLAMPLVISNLKPQALNLVIVGEGPEKENLKKLTKKLKIDKFVEFRGFLDDLSTIYPTFDIYIQPSQNEAFGIAPLEAMSYGIPVVASNVGGLSELILDKKTGFLVPPKNPKALSEAIIKLLKNEKLRKKMGEAARERAKEFSQERMAKETEKIYCQVI